MSDLVLIIQFNEGFALTVKAVFLFLAFTGHTSLLVGHSGFIGAPLVIAKVTPPVARLILL